MVSTEIYFIHVQMIKAEIFPVGSYIKLVDIGDREVLQCPASARTSSVSVLHPRPTRHASMGPHRTGTLADLFIAYPHRLEQRLVPSRHSIGTCSMNVEHCLGPFRLL